MKHKLTNLLVVLLTLAVVAVRAQTPPPGIPLPFASAPDPGEPILFRRSAPSEAYLTNLRSTYKLDDVIAGKTTDLARVQAVCAWVHQQWKHNGSNTPQQSDPVAILQEAAQGKRFRCVEYGVVLEGALTALGIPARRLGLETADVETRKSGAGHVLAEAWLQDQQKWMLVDGQWDVIPALEGVPLNAVELQKALATHQPGLAVLSPAGTTTQKYTRWIQPYLFYFTTSLDARFDAKRAPGELVLVPVGAKNPEIFQRIYPMKNRRYTNSVASFYASPQ